MNEDSLERDGIKWGAEIDGDRPNWLTDDDTPVKNKIGNVLTAEDWIPSFAPYQLPADHPYYAQKKREIAPALVERMVALMRSVSNGEHVEAGRARDILKALEPIDPDLLEARRCVVMAYEGIGRKDLALQADSGKMDSRLRVQACLSAIKRGRELEANA